MTLTADEKLFLDMMHEENFEKDFLEWCEHMEAEFA